MKITNIKDDGFDYEWDSSESWSINSEEFIKKYSAKKLAEYFLQNKTLRWEGNSYREVFGTGTLLDKILIYHFDDLGKDLWKKTLSAAFNTFKLDSGFDEKIMNIQFRHNEINIDPDTLMEGIAPMIKANQIYKRSHTDNMELNQEMVLPYFKALNDKITKRKANDIFEDFDPQGRTFLGIDVQNWLIDNNKYIREIIEEEDLIVDYPPSTVRDIFIF